MDNNPLRKTCLLVLTPSKNLIYLGGVDIKWNGPVLAPNGKSKSAYTSFISDTVPYWWRRCSLVLQCFLENCREGEIYVVVGSVLTRMSLDVSVECYFLSIMKHPPPTILLTNELIMIEYCSYHLFLAVYSFFLLHYCPPSPWCGPSSWSVQCLRV